MTQAFPSIEAHLDALRNLIYSIDPNSKLVIHSSLLGFGRISTTKINLISKSILSLSMGPIAFPSHSHLGFKNRVYDYYSTFDKRLGHMASIAHKSFQAGDAIRTQSAIHSYSIVNPDASPDAYGIRSCSFGNKSVFQAFKDKSYLWLNIGCPPQSGYTIIHNQEANNQCVRREIFFPVEYINGSNSDLIDYQYFSLRGKLTNVNANIDTNTFKDSALYYSNDLPSKGIVTLHRIQELSDLIDSMLAQSPFWFTNKCIIKSLS